MRAFDREILRSAFVSLFWNVIAFRKEHGGFALKVLSDKIGVNKSAPSRWFSGVRPNWTIDTISDIAEALGVDITIAARDRQSGMVFTVNGEMPEAVAENLTVPTQKVHTRGGFQQPPSVCSAQRFSRHGQWSVGEPVAV